MSVVIKMKGLPFESTAKDIQLFFEGLYLRDADIHLAAYKDGKASGIAFAVFQNDEDARQAMFRNEKYMGKRYIELFLSSSTEMKTVLQDGVPDPRPPKNEDRNTLDPQEQRRSRNPSRQDQSGPRNVLDRLGRSPNRQGDERKEFSSRNRSRSPRRRVEPGKDSNVRGRGGFRGRGGRGGRGGREERGRGRGSNYGQGHDTRQVEISTSVPSLLDRNVSQQKARSDSESLERFQRVRNERANTGESMGFQQTYQRDFQERNALDNDGDRHRGTGYRQESSSFDGDRARQRADPLITETCVHLYGLPFQVTEKEIMSFFKGLDVVTIKLLYHTNGKFAGKKTGEGFVEFGSFHDANEAGKKNKQHLGSRYVEVITCSKMAMLNATERNEGDMKNSNDNPFGGSTYAPPKHPISDLAINIDTELFKQDMERSRMMDRGLNLPNLGLTLPSEPYISSESLELQTMSTLNQLASTANVNPEDVAAGCVVGIRNLPSSIKTEEILDFFYGYVVYPDSIRIHYLAPGRSSGDAMVTFRNSREATVAIQELNHKHVGKRSVQLFLV